MSAIRKDAKVQVTEGPTRGVTGVIESVEGAMVRVRVGDLPPRLERADVGAFVVVRSVHVRVL